MGKDWLGAPLIKEVSVCAKCKKEARLHASLATWGPGARSRALVGSRGKAPGGGSGGKAPKSS